MPMLTRCTLDGKELDIEDALALRDDARRLGASRPDFSCVECLKAVRPHKAGRTGGAHFEHLERNKACTKSDT